MSAAVPAVNMDEVFKTVSEKLAGESTSYGALQYLQSFVARKKKVLGKDNTSKVVFHGAACLIKNGNGKDAGNALQWYIESPDLFYIDVTAGDGGYCDTGRVLDLFKKFKINQLEPCASVIYDPLHKAVVDSMTTLGIHTDSLVAKRMHSFDEMCADIFEKTKVWRSAYRVCVRLNLIERAAGILNKWADMPDCYMNEKPLFFCRSILTLLADDKAAASNAMAQFSKKYLKEADNASCDPPTPGGEDSAHLACWHLAVIIAELAVLPPAPRVDKARLFNVLTNLYAEMVDRIDSNLVTLLEKVGVNVFQLGKKKVAADPMNMLQAMMNMGGGKTAAPGAGGSAGLIGGMDVNKMLSMLNQMEGKR